MGVSETYGINGYSSANDVKNNPYISKNASKVNFKSSPYEAKSVLEKIPQQDMFTLQSKPFAPSQSEKFLSSMQDMLLANLQPESFVAKYTSKDFLERAVKNNPEIAEMLKKQDTRLQIAPENMQNICKSHLIPTMTYAKQIIHGLKSQGMNFSNADINALTQAALLHDLGKVLIPSEILNKKDTLTEKEREVIKLHNELSYELLKSTTLSPEVLQLVRNHHSYKPHNKSEGKAQILEEILRAADVYSALKEQRAYKSSMNDKSAFEILAQDAQSGEFSMNIVNALIASHKEPITEKVNAA